MSEREKELLNKIKKLHLKLELETGNKYEINIKSSNNPNSIITFGTLNDNMDTKKKYIIENLTHFKELEDSYDSLEEFKDVALQYFKVNSIKPYLRIDLNNGLINYGKERSQTIGKIRIIG